MHTRILLLVAMGSLLSLKAWAGTMLYDFETEAEVLNWHDEVRPSQHRSFPTTREPHYATSGQYAMCFRSPAWQPGMAEWPACEGKPTLTDWTGHDRLIFDVTNPTAHPQKLVVFIADEGHATRDGLMCEVDLAPYAYRAVVVPLSQLVQKGQALDGIRVMHWFTQRPAGDMEVYLDRLMLLREGEELPPVPSSFLREFGALQADSVAAMRQTLGEAGQRLQRLAEAVPGAAAWGQQSLSDLTREVEAFAAAVAEGSPAILEGNELNMRLMSAIERLETLGGLRADFEPVRKAVTVDASTRADVVVGFATSMQKVLPRGVAPELRVSRRTSIALARHEKEAFQVIVLPCEREARHIQVRASDLLAADGSVFASANVKAVPVGYVETKSVPPYGSSHIGWWPDPILDFMSAADVAVGDAQSFWVRVAAPRDQAPGRYRGKLEVLEAGRPLYSFDLNIEVYPFSVPKRSPLPMAVTFAPMYYEPNGQGGWQEGAYRDTSWQRHKAQWGDFLADYYLMYDSLYHRGQPEFPILQRLHQQGRLDMFNLGYYTVMPEDAEGAAAWKADIDQRVGAGYQKAKQLGILDHAYIYGCDEHPEAMFPGVERAAAYLKEHFPGTLILTTTYDHSFGTDSVLQSMDGFCPLTPSYKRDLADNVRATGKQVWWYICCGPHHPFANMFIEYPAIDGRVLMGAQTAKYRPDGFLYYETSIWNSPPITSGPFTDYDPRSWTTYHGDGSWTCPGPDGTPLATVRLENFRDGIEDYAYALTLERLIQQVERSPQASARADWLSQARKALGVPAGLARSMTEFTSDPADVYRWRRGMAEAIRDCGVEVEE